MSVSEEDRKKLRIIIGEKFAKFDITLVFNNPQRLIITINILCKHADLLHNLEQFIASAKVMMGNVKCDESNKTNSRHSSEFLFISISALVSFVTSP